MDASVILLSVPRSDRVPPLILRLITTWRSGGEMQEAQVSGVQLLKPGEDPAIVLDLVDEAFDQMTLPVALPQ